MRSSRRVLGFALFLITAAVQAELDPRYFATRPGVLVATKARLAAGDPTLQSALRALIESADQALTVTPPPSLRSSRSRPAATLTTT